MRSIFSNPRMSALRRRRLHGRTTTGKRPRCRKLLVERLEQRALLTTTNVTDDAYKIIDFEFAADLVDGPSIPVVGGEFTGSGYIHNLPDNRFVARYFAQGQGSYDDGEHAGSFVAGLFGRAAYDFLVPVETPETHIGMSGGGKVHYAFVPFFPQGGLAASAGTYSLETVGVFTPAYMTIEGSCTWLVRSIPDALITGTVTDTNADPFGVYPTWLLWKGDSVELAFRSVGKPMNPERLDQPVTTVELYWTSARNTSSIIEPVGAPVPVYWNQAGATAEITGITNIPDNARYLLAWAWPEFGSGFPFELYVPVWFVTHQMEFKDYEFTGTATVDGAVQSVNMVASPAGDIELYVDEQPFSATMQLEGTLSYDSPILGRGGWQGQITGGGDVAGWPDPVGVGGQLYEEYGMLTMDLEFAPPAPETPGDTLFLFGQFDTSDHSAALSWKLDELQIYGHEASYGTCQIEFSAVDSGPADIVVSNAYRTPNGVMIRYGVSGPPLAAPDALTPAAEVGVYWASGPSANDIIKSALPEPLIPGMMDALPIFWNLDMASIELTDLVPAPTGATHLLVVADRDNHVAEADETNNVFATPFRGANSVGDLVWHDVNENGLQDAGEPGLAGVVVELYWVGHDGTRGTPDDVLIDSTVTDATGHYLFENLPDETYYLRFFPPPGFHPTLSNVGTDDTIDSDPLAPDSLTDPFLLNGGIHDTTRDAGSVGGTPPLDLGTIDYTERKGENPPAGRLLYRFAPVRNGVISAAVENYTGDPLLTLYGYDGQVLATATSGQQLDYPFATAGQTYYLEVSGLTVPADVILGNLVQWNQDGRQVSIFGTEGDDWLEASVADFAALRINRLQYWSDVVESLGFEDLGGNDTVSLSTPLNEVELYLVPGEIGGEFETVPFVSELDFELEGVEFFEADLLGTGDFVEFGATDPAVAETVFLGPRFVDWQGGAFHYTVRGGETVHGTAGGGGNDRVEFHDSDGDDTFEVGPAGPNSGAYDAAMWGTTLGGMSYQNSVRGFSKIDAVAGAGGDDSIVLYDSATTDDKLSVVTTYSCLVLPGRYNVRGFGFENLTAHAGAGGMDTVYVWTAGGDDHLVGNPSRLQLMVGDQPGGTVSLKNVVLNGFAAVTIRSGEGTDTASLSDGGAGTADILTNRAAGGVTCLAGPTYKHWFVGFDQLEMTASDAADRAYLVGHDGPETFTYYAAPTGPSEKVQLAGTAPDGRLTSAIVSGFGSVYAYAGSGGQDVALFYDSPITADRYWAGPNWACMQGTGFYARGAGFEAYEAHFSGGGSGDTATLYDSPTSADQLEAHPDFAKLVYAADASRYVRSEGHRWLRSFASSAPVGVDLAQVYLPAGSNEQVLGSFTNPQATAKSSVFYAYVKQYGRVEVYGNATDSDTARMWDSSADEHLAADGLTVPNLATISNLVFTLELWDLSNIEAIGNQGGDNTKDVDNEALLDFVLETTGSWRDV